MSIYWGWLVLKDTPWLPWYLGGQAGGCFTNMIMNTPFPPEFTQALLDYSLFTFSYHFNNLV